MNRVLKIVIYAVVVFLIYLWISSVAKSCNKPATKSDISAAEEANGDFTYDDEIYDEYFEDEQSSDEVETIDVSESEKENMGESSDYDVNDFTYEASEEEVKALSSEPKASSTPQKSNPVRQTSSSSYSDDKYLVIAGSYLIKDNAEKMVDKLKNLGFYDAEIVTFDMSQYYSISAGRYDDYAMASNVASQVKNNGIDCYVHTKKD